MEKSESKSKLDDLQETFLDAAETLARAAESDAKSAAPSTCEKALNAARASLIFIENYEKLTRLL